jgi:hypothetical protein
VFRWREFSAFIPKFTQGVNKWIELEKRGIRGQNTVGGRLVSIRKTGGLVRIDTARPEWHGNAASIAEGRHPKIAGIGLIFNGEKLLPVK